MTPLEDVQRSYDAAFRRYLFRHEEIALHAGYELGRAAVADGMSLLELTQVHHRVLLSALRQSPSEDLAEVATAASEFLLEVLAPFDMTQRRFITDTGG